ATARRCWPAAARARSCRAPTRPRWASRSPSPGSRPASRARCASTSAAAKSRCASWPGPSCAAARPPRAFDPAPRAFATLATPTLHQRCFRSTAMSEIPGDLKFMKSHEWARIEGDGKVTVGISDHAQDLLGDLVYVDLPDVGDSVEAGNACAVLESVKAASDIYAPVSGTITEVNSALADKPETINEDAYGDGWLFVIEASDPDQAKELLAPDDYAALIEGDE